MLTCLTKRWFQDQQRATINSHRNWMKTIELFQDTKVIDFTTNSTKIALVIQKHFTKKKRMKRYRSWALNSMEMAMQVAWIRWTSIIKAAVLISSCQMRDYQRCQIRNHNHWMKSMSKMKMTLMESIKIPFLKKLNKKNQKMTIKVRKVDQL